MNIIKITNPDLKSEICNTILRNLPLWFGIESAIVDYVHDVKEMATWVVYENEKAIGFISINQHFPETSEIHVVGILEKYHRTGIGIKLLEIVEADLRSLGTQFLTVKTLSKSRSNEEYEKTRKFYLKAGFKPLEEFKTLWGEHNPCLFMVKSL